MTDDPSAVAPGTITPSDPECSAGQDERHEKRRENEHEEHDGPLVGEPVAEHGKKDDTIRCEEVERLRYE